MKPPWLFARVWSHRRKTGIKALPRLICYYIVIIFNCLTQGWSYIQPTPKHTTIGAMKTKVIRIGNSQGVRIPKALIEESGITDEIEMILRDHEIVLRSVETTRKDWEASFQKMAEQGDDALLDQEELEKPSSWDDSEWTW